jgi:cold shock CspA family protein
VKHPSPTHRLQGRIESWNDERGFGFVVQNATGSKAFVHISAFAKRHRRPVVGALVTYEVGRDERGRPRAVDVRFVEGKRAREPRSAQALGSLVVGVVLACIIITVGYVSLSQPNSSIPASINKLVSHPDALRENPAFRCEPRKTYCSEMSSCAEAYFHQERCGGTEMDGDGDGIPCEKQWCQ